MKASSSIGSAPGSDKAFGLSAGAATGGQQSSGAGFLAMLDGMIQTGAGSTGTGLSNGNMPKQQDATAGDQAAASQVLASDAADSDAADADTADETIVADAASDVSASAAPVQVLPSAITFSPLQQSSVQTSVMGTQVAAPPSNKDDANALAALAVQAGIVPVAVQAAPVAETRVTDASAATAIAASSNAAAALPVLPVAATQPAFPVAPAAAPAETADTSDQATATAAVLVANAGTFTPVSAPLTSIKTQTAQPTSKQSDQDNADTQQSAILSALFAQAPLQATTTVSSADTSSASAKPVSGPASSGSAAGTLSVPGVGIPPTLSPPAFVGNGIHTAGAAFASSAQGSNIDNNQAFTPASGASAALDFGIGSNAAAASSNDTDTNGDGDDIQASSAPAITPNNQAKAETIASLFAAPLTVAKTDKLSDGSDAVVAIDKVASVAAPQTDIGTTGLTLVHQSTTVSAAGSANAATGTAATSYTSPADQVSVIMQRAAVSNTQSMTIALNPVELGKVEVKLDFAKDGSVQASVTAERPETLTMLKNDHSTLTQALHNAGLTTNSNSLSFNLKDGGQSQQQQGFAGASSYRPGTNIAENEIMDAPVSTTTVQYAVSNSNGRLDVTV